MEEKIKDGQCIHGARWILYKNIENEEEYMDVAMPFMIKKGKPVKLCNCNKKSPQFVEIPPNPKGLGILSVS